MGSGVQVVCKKCGFRSSLYEGVGSAYPSYIDELKEQARKGEFGEKLKAAVEEHPDGIINGAECLYVCDQCGYWQIQPKLGYYVSTTGEAELFEEPGRTKRLYTPRHRCGKCDHIMRAVELSRQPEL